MTLVIPTSDTCCSSLLIYGAPHLICLPDAGSVIRALEASLPHRPSSVHAKRASMSLLLLSDTTLPTLRASALTQLPPCPDGTEYKQTVAPEHLRSCCQLILTS